MPEPALRRPEPRISIQPRGIHVPSALESYIRRRLTTETNALGWRVNCFAVNIEHSEGQGGGWDKVCVITAELGSGDVLVTRQTNQGLIASLDGAIRKMNRALCRNRITE